jgi:hypothetical protein
MVTQAMACPTVLRITTITRQGWLGHWRITTAVRQPGFGQQPDCNYSQSIGPIKELIKAKR